MAEQYDKESYALLQRVGLISKRRLLLPSADEPNRFNAMTSMMLIFANLAIIIPYFAFSEVT